MSHLVGHEEDPLLDVIQNAIDDWDPRALVNPYLKAVPPEEPTGNIRHAVRRQDLLEFIADADAAVQLGKAFFWEMQAGSDFHRSADGSFGGTACASCHYRSGVDPRDRHTTRVPYVGWTGYALDPAHDAGKAAGEYDPQLGQFKQLGQKNNVAVPSLAPSPSPAPDKFDGKPRWVPEPQDDPRNLSLIFGSQGVERRVFKGFTADREHTAADGTKFKWRQEIGESPKGSGSDTAASRFQWEMFRREEDGRDLRQITNRNAPTVVNATFADRLFHDGRAESTFNGFSIFGDDDGREVVHKRTRDLPARLIPVRIAVSHAALASQAVGPVVNEVEMSYAGRTFPDLADKLLPARVLFAQTIDPNDSVFKGTNIQAKTYAELIKKAFREEWWSDEGVLDPRIDLELKLGPKISDPDGGYHRDPAKGSLMQANFSLYWGLSLMLYQSTLISNDSPFDRMMRGDARGVWDAWERNKARIGDVRLDRIVAAPPGEPDVSPVPADELDEDSRLRARRLEKGRSGTPPDNPKILATAVFQRGMRVFQNADCRDCHDGPNFSEQFDRTANNQIELPIGRRLSHALFPNSQGDAAALTLAAVRARLVADLAALVKEKKKDLTDALARGVASDLVRRLGQLEGEFWKLDDVAKQAFDGHGVPHDVPFVRAVAARLIQFELRSREGLGRRPFFTERQRIALAELITAPVLIEKMLIPEDQAFARRPLPSGGVPSDPQAFYDAGFYTLGLTHPRFDFGVGGIPDIDADDDHPTRANVRQAAQGAAGSAYRFQADRKGRGASTRDKHRPGPRPAKPAAKDKVPADPPPHPDVSWSRTQVPPEIDWRLMVEPRRSRMHFLSRARELVVDEEAWGHRKPFLHDNELMFWGGFKTPALRNVELTGPYMHNGQLQSLEEVIEFYDGGGIIERSADFNPDKHPRIRRMDLTTDDKKALLFFLLCLTDEAVRAEKGPFDHPSLRVPNGYDSDWKQQWVPVAALGRDGGSVVGRPNNP
ncbi:cytochrome c peroxidase [Paludisphaera mucosa]|uniref:Cytochrome c peroxidase n=1 Tax=Paludisphaera mucosa TaxID=3030827 RepID=A0ABT6F9X6_9BACT|nr:cytochrome c peroxidase [Paludisphaera mucosa]